MRSCPGSLIAAGWQPTGGRRATRIGWQRSGNTAHRAGVLFLNQHGATALRQGLGNEQPSGRAILGGQPFRGRKHILQYALAPSEQLPIQDLPAGGRKLPPAATGMLEQLGEPNQPPMISSGPSPATLDDGKSLSRPPAIQDSRQPGTCSHAHPRWLPWGIFLLLLSVYHLNGDFLVGNDAKPNVFLSVSLLNEGNLTFTPTEMPFMFRWELKVPDGVRAVDPLRTNQEFNGHTAAQLIAQGLLTPKSERYYIVPTRKPGHYVPAYGPVPGLLALPMTLPLHLWLGDLRNHPRTLWFAAKTVAALIVAASAVVVYLTARTHLPWRWATLISATYGLGTAVWSTSSQALWQHGPDALFLAIGACFLSRLEARRHQDIGCGLALGLAVACRPTGVVFVAAVAIHLLRRNRLQALRFLLAAGVVGVLLMAHNAYYFGSPFQTGQFIIGKQIALKNTGSSELWQTPLWKGLSGLMLSPSRGVFIYSPVLLFALLGLPHVWRDRNCAYLRPFALGTALVIIITAHYFNWWGGWSFGYRYLCGLMPVAVLLMAPSIRDIARKRWLLACFCVLLAWSIGVQWLGASAYNLVGWNLGLLGQYQTETGLRQVRIHAPESVPQLSRSLGAKVTVVPRNVDKPENQARLWTIRDSQLVYYVQHYAAARRTRKALVRKWHTRP